MTKCFFGSRTLSRGGALGAVLTVVVAGSAMAKPAPPAAPAAVPTKAAAPAAPTPAAAPATMQTLATTAESALANTTTVVSSAACSTPQLSQPFASWQDNNWYTLAPGESADSFDGGGWTLLNGANIQTERLNDGQSGSVLDLPSGAEAISPPMCVDSDYPTARTMVQTTGGAQVAAGVFYGGAAPKSQYQLSGTIQGTGAGFSLSQPLQVHPGNQTGWQMVQFIFGSTGSAGDGQIYNFYVDPRMSR
jgi:hypothetical protein